MKEKESKTNNKFIKARIFLLLCFNSIKMGDFTNNEKTLHNAENISSFDNFYFRSYDETKNIINILFEGRDEDDRKHIEKICNNILNIVLEGKNMQTYFKDKYKIWQDEILNQSTFLYEICIFLLDSKIFDKKKHKEIIKTCLPRDNIAKRLIKKLTNLLYGPTTSSIDDLKEKKELYLQLSKKKKSDLRFFEKTLWINVNFAQEYRLIKECLADNAISFIVDELFNYIGINEGIHLDDKKGMYVIAEDVCSLIKVLKIKLDTAKATLNILREYFILNPTCNNECYTWKMMDSFIFDLYHSSDTKRCFTAIIYKFIDDMEMNGKNELKMIIETNKQKINIIMISVIEKLKILKSSNPVCE